MSDSADTMASTPKTKALAFAGTLLLISTAMVGTAIATTGTVLSPFARGEDFAHERSMTRGHHAALGLVVVRMVGGELEPVPGALVVVTHPAADAPAVTKTTNERGVAIFDLRPGLYRITVTQGELAATQEFPVRFSVRVGLFFDEDGQPHWRAAPHRDLERRGDTVGLMVRVGENRSGERAPVQGAVLRIYSLDAEGNRELVAEATTGPRGFAAFQLHRGAYVLNVTAGDVSAERSGVLRAPTGVGILIDGDEVHWRVAQYDPHRSGSPTPTRSTHPPARGA